MTRHDSATAWEKDRAHLLHPYTDFASFAKEGSQVIEKAEGMHVIDTEGKTLLDAIAGLWCVNIGHGRKEMAETIAQQVMDMQYYNPFGHSTNVPASLLGAKLAELAPGNLNHVYYTCGGSTANDAAIRLVHYYFDMKGQPRKKKIISRQNGYHGATYVAASLTGIHGTKYGFDRIGEDFIHHVSEANLYAKPEAWSDDEYCDFLVHEFDSRIQQLGPDNCAAFIAEPIMVRAVFWSRPKAITSASTRSASSTTCSILPTRWSPPLAVLVNGSSRSRFMTTRPIFWSVPRG